MGIIHANMVHMSHQGLSGTSVGTHPTYLSCLISHDAAGHPGCEGLSVAKDHDLLCYTQSVRCPAPVSGVNGIHPDSDPARCGPDV